MTAETILSALQDGAKFHWQLPKLGNTDELIRLLEKRGKIIKEPDPKLGICRFRLSVPPKENGDTKPCRTCLQERHLDLYAKYSSTCSVCVDTTKKRKEERRKQLAELFKQGKKQCATCGVDHHLYRFKKFTSGNRSKECQGCLTARRNAKIGETE